MKVFFVVTLMTSFLAPIASEADDKVIPIKDFAYISVKSESGTKPYTGDAFDNYVLAQEAVSYLVSFVGQERIDRIGANGVTNSNRAWEQGAGPLFVETQKVGYQVIRAGVAAQNRRWVDKGLLALEWGLQPSVMGEDGSFPDQRETETLVGRALHPKSIFLDSAAHAVLLIRQSDLPNSYKKRAEALVPRLHLAASEIVKSGDAAKFFKVGANSSQLAFVASAIHQIGLLAGDDYLIEVAKAQMQAIIAGQRLDGSFPEKGGSDTSYQMNTIELITSYNATQSPGDWRDSVALSNQRAVDWFLLRVREDGTIDTTGNTRQEACGSIPGYFPKGLDIDNIPIRLYYFAYLSGKMNKIGPIASKIQFQGITYDHVGDCANRVID